jgi:hypothetical protein
MKSTDQVPTTLERRGLIVFGLVLLAVIGWGLVENSLFQVAFLLAVIAVVLEGILLAAAWRHGLGWLFSRGALRLYGWLGVGLISLVLLFYAEEAWRGKRAWVDLMIDLKHRGDSIELSSVVPPPVPDEQNFVQAPGVAKLLGYGQVEPARSSRGGFFCGPPERWPAASWALGQATDLRAWQKYFRQPPVPGSPHWDEHEEPLSFPTPQEPGEPAADVLVALSCFDTNLAILRSAAGRPFAHFPVEYAKGYWALYEGGVRFPKDTFLGAANVLSLRASAELAQNQAELALGDILLALRLGDTLRQEPFAVAHYTRAEMFMRTLQPVWEGLAGHKWNTAQLAVLQERFSAMTWRSDFRACARGETLLLLDAINQVQAFFEHRHSAFGDRLATQTKADERLVIWLVSALYPTGWLYQDKVWLYRYYEQHERELSKTGFREASRQQLLAALRRATDPQVVIQGYPKLSAVYEESDKAVYFDTVCQQVKTACALERYRLDKGSYPVSLNALLPAYLAQVPQDILDPSDSPLRYSSREHKSYELYSVGWNRQDDRAQPSPVEKDWRGTQRLFPRLTKGDWVWRIGS